MQKPINQQVFKDKTSEQLAQLQVQIENKIANHSEGIDVGHWVSVLNQLKAHLAQHQAINNRRWNHLLCSNFGIITIVLVLFLTKYIISWWILNHFKLNKVETIQFSYSFQTFVYCVVIPFAIYARNEKLYKHVKNEISDFLYG